MKPVYTLANPLATATLLLFGGLDYCCLAQFDSAALPVNNLIDSRIESYFSPPIKQQNRIELFSEKAFTTNRLFNLQPLPALAPTNFWITRDLGANYNYSRKHNKVSDTDTDTHSGAVSFFLDSQIGLSAKPAFKFSSGETGSSGRGNSTSHAINPSFSIGLELLHLIKGEQYNPKEQATSVVLGGSFGYADVDKDTISSAGILSSTHIGTWNYGVLLSLGHYFRRGDDEGVGALLGTVTPSYNYLDNRNADFSSSAITLTDSGVFSLAGQLDFALTSATKLTALATWNHDINQKVPSGGKSHFQDWAEFGGQFSAKLGPSIKVKAGYSYEAFNTDYYTHKVIIALDAFF